LPGVPLGCLGMGVMIRAEAPPLRQRMRDESRGRVRLVGQPHAVSQRRPQRCVPGLGRPPASIYPLIGLPARGLNPDTNDIRVVTSPAPRTRLGRKPFVDQTGNHACVEASVVSNDCVTPSRPADVSKRAHGVCSAVRLIAVPDRLPRRAIQARWCPEPLGAKCRIRA